MTILGLPSWTLDTAVGLFLTVTVLATNLAKGGCLNLRFDNI